MKKILRRGDFLLLFLFIASAALIAAAPLLHPAAEAGKVRITCRGEEYGIYPLDENRTVEVIREGHSNVVSIQDSTVHMESADCHNQVCVETGTISCTGETIVCLPNRVVVEILADGKGGDADDAVDAVVK